MRSTALGACLFVVACGSGTSSTTPIHDPNTPPAGDQTSATANEPPPAPVPSKPVTTMSLAAIGLDPNALDRKADPCEDFYQFACGGWIAKTEIPADKPMAMRSFVAIDDRNLEFLHTTFEGYAKTPGKDPIHKQIGTYYGACMNEKAIERAGIRPIARVRALINQVRDVKSLSRTIAQLHAAGFDALFGMGPTQDEANAKNVIIGIDQGGLGLPDRDYYLKDDAQKKAIRGAYENYVTSMLTELGDKPAVAKADAAKIIALETEIAKVSKDKVARRDPKGMYNKIDKAGVSNAMPSFDWKTYWRIVGLTKVNDVDVTAPKFLSGIDKLLASTPAATWRAYLTFHVGSDAANMLTKKLVDTKFAFQKAITGQPEIPARWKRCVKATTGALPDLVGQVFVDKRFSGDSKKAAVSYVHAISDAMKTNLQALPWMDPTTKERAEAKREAMAYQIGYPPKWKSYTFKLGRNYGTNALAAQRAETVRQFAKIGKPVDLDDWDFPASLVNAFYSAEKNRMVFPAGILQPPFYSVDSSVPVNLGAMGMVVGHELTHGFDDQGAQFDGDGNLKNWWQPETEKRFKARTQCVIDQYNKYTVAGGAHVNGANTVGENIADIGGIKLALSAYRTLRSTAPDTVVADGFTEDQQFFLSFGQSWCAKMRPDFEKLLASVDVHSPARWRVNGALAATPEFAKAFRCKAGAKLAPAKQCVVW